MAREDLVYKVGVDASDAVGGLRKLEGAVRSTMREVGDELDDSATAGDKFAASIDRLSSQMREDFNSAAIAAEELQRALRQAGSSLEVGDAIAELNRMGISFDEITQDADKFAASLKQLDDVRMAGVRDLDSVAPGLATKLDNVQKSADSSKGALANMVGNSAQDLGQMAGVAGSAGVAVGQMAEYFADAKFEGEGLGSVLKSFAGVAAPIAALALVTQTASEMMARFSSSQTRTTESVKRWSDAMDEGGDATDAYVDSLRDVGKVTLDVTRSQSGLENVVSEMNDSWWQMGAGTQILGRILGATTDETKDMTEALTRAGITAETWTKAIESGATGTEALGAVLAASNLSAGEQADIMTTLGQAQTDHAAAAKADAIATAFFGVEADDAAESTEDLAAAHAEAVKAARDHKVAISDAAGALGELAASIGEIRSDAISGVFEQFGKPEADAGKIRDIAGAIAALPETLKDLEGVKLSDVLAGSFQADPFLDAVDSIGAEMRDRMAGAFAEGNAQGAKDIAEQTIRDVVAAMGGKLTGEQVSTLLGLDDLEAQIDVATNLSDIDRVKRELEVLTGVTGATPLTASIALALDAGTITPAAAEALVRGQLGAAGVEVPSTLGPPSTQEALAEAGAFMASQVVPIPTAADPHGFTRDAADLAADDYAPATVPIEGDARDAEDTRDDFVDETERTKPIIDIKGETKEAIGLLVALRIYAALLAPKVDVTADVSSAVSSLNGLAQRTTRVPVDAYLADYPSASEIQRAIGRPRIPVDIVVGQSIRITGVRE